MQELYIKDLIVSGHHGANPGEKDAPQRFSVTIEVGFDMSLAAKSDDVKDTLDWSRLRDIVVGTIENTSYNLVERLAQEIITRTTADARVLLVTLIIDKLDAFPDGVPGIIFHYERP